MSTLLDDKTNLAILEHICNGAGVEVNISALAKSLRKHRDTIRDRVKDLFDYRIINKPVYPFIWLYQEYPLLVIVNADIPREPEYDQFLKEDEHIFGAFFVRDQEYNTFLIEYHKDISSYVDWRKKIVKEKKIPPRHDRTPTSASFLSNKHIIKYTPYSPIFQMEDRLQRGEEIYLNNYKINDVNFQILKSLMLGNCIRTNENLLARQLNINRKTIERRISALLNSNIIEKPACRFPKFFVPPDHFLVYYLIEVKTSMSQVIKAIKSDPSIPMALEASIGRYNLLLFQVFSTVDEHLEWELEYSKRFPGAFGAMRNIYLSPKMTVSINQQKISLGIIRNRMERLHGKGLIDLVR